MQDWWEQFPASLHDLDPCSSPCWLRATGLPNDCIMIIGWWCIVIKKWSRLVIIEWCIAIIGWWSCCKAKRMFCEELRCTSNMLLSSYWNDVWFNTYMVNDHWSWTMNHKPYFNTDKKSFNVICFRMLMSSSLPPSTSCTDISYIRQVKSGKIYGSDF